MLPVVEPSSVAFQQCKRRQQKKHAVVSENDNFLLNVKDDEHPETGSKVLQYSVESG